MKADLIFANPRERAHLNDAGQEEYRCIPQADAAQATSVRLANRNGGRWKHYFVQAGHPYEATLFCRKCGEVRTGPVWAAAPFEAPRAALEGATE